MAAIVVVAVVVGGGVYIYATSGGGATSTSGTQTNTAPTYTALTLQAGGSTFVNPVMGVWAAGFQDFTSGAVKTNYQALGSGAGITGILQGTFDFAGSDAPVSTSLSANYTAKNGPLLQIPETLGAVAIFYNIPGVSTSINLTGPILAKIYLQQITMWSDPAILAINPHANATLLNHTIVPVHRSDGSGTTYALTNYFTKVSSDWNASGKGFGTSINWPSSGELGGKGSAGVAGYVSQNQYSIGYADSYYAFSNKLVSANIENQAGKFVAPSLDAVTAAAAAFSVQVQANPTFSITNAPGATSYPISTFTYLLVWQNQTNQGKGNDIAQFFQWIVTRGQSLGPPLYYPQLPANVVSIDQILIAKMNYNGVSFIGS